MQLYVIPRKRNNMSGIQDFVKQTLLSEVITIFTYPDIKVKIIVVTDEIVFKDVMAPSLALESGTSFPRRIC